MGETYLYEYIKASVTAKGARVRAEELLGAEELQTATQGSAKTEQFCFMNGYGSLTN